MTNGFAISRALFCAFVVHVRSIQKPTWQVPQRERFSQAAGYIRPLQTDLDESPFSCEVNC